MSAHSPTGIVTFLFTDIEGSTKLAQKHPDAWQELNARHDVILREAIGANDGYVFKVIGDSFCSAFPTAGAALLAGLQIQRELNADEVSSALGVSIRARIGIHTGKAELQANGDYNGYLTISRVQRLMSAGHGGQTLISLATQEFVRDELPQGIILRDLGEHRLKDLIQPERIYQVDAPDLPSAFPALRTLDIQRNNLPPQLTHFVGRKREIAALLDLLRNPGVRLVTLTGAGGTGKTRISLQVATELLDEFEHGAWFVELESIADPELVLPAIAAALKVSVSAETTVQQALRDYLRARQLLLVLDNFEQVVSAASKITDLLNAAPKIKIMVSSREVLRLRGEHDYPVPPLGLPESKRRQTAAVLAQYEAIALFVQHAQAANPSFVLDEDNASIVADICSRLDGLPLALELAAARSRLFTPTTMLAKMKSRLEALAGNARDLPHRQQTIRGAIGWSYDLLDDAEKILFARLGIFVGGWTLDSAESVCGGEGGADVLNGIESLLDKSLVRQTEGKSGEMRFAMLETIREYAFEKLSQSSDFESIRQKHADGIMALLDKARIATGSPEEAECFARLDDEMDNLRAVVEWTLGNSQPATAILAGRLMLYWTQRVNIREPLRWLERALALPVNMPPAEKAYALNSAAGYYKELLDLQNAKTYYEEALSLFLEAGEKDGLTRVYNNLAGLETSAKNHEQARQLLEKSLACAEPNSWVAAIILNNLGALEREVENWEQSRQYYLRARETSQRIGSETGISVADLCLAALDLALGNLKEARAGFEKGFNAAWIRANPLQAGLEEGVLAYIDLLMGGEKDARQKMRRSLEAAAEFVAQTPHLFLPWMPLEGRARLDTLDGRMERAAQLFGAAWTQRGNDGRPLSEFERPDYETRVDAVRNALGDETFHQLFDKGKTMTLKDAIALALEEGADAK
ncbi:MAG: tetratricopeptide repeat protein [Chloroflexi bacterium]|nr:tetratricopeptide repeat protein [Chloroflexota bacterium]